MKPFLLFTLFLSLVAGASLLLLNPRAQATVEQLPPPEGAPPLRKGEGQQRERPSCPPVDDDAVSRLGEYLIKRQTELQAREEKLVAREEALKALHVQINMRVAELNSLIRYDSLLSQQGGKAKSKQKRPKRRGSVAARVPPQHPSGRADQKLLSILQNLDPKAAGRVLSGVAPRRAARIMYSLASDQAARIMQKMPPQVAGKVAQFMAPPEPSPPGGETPSKETPGSPSPQPQSGEAEALFKPKGKAPTERSGRRSMQRRRRPRRRRAPKAPFMPVKRVK